MNDKQIRRLAQQKGVQVKKRNNKWSVWHNGAEIASRFSPREVVAFLNRLPEKG